MADNEEKVEAVPRGNEWEVVSLTASAYTAAPGPDVDPSHDSQAELGGESEAETSNAMFMSRHFVFPPSQHENLPLEPEYTEIHDEKGVEHDASHVVREEGEEIDAGDEENVSVRGLMSDEFSGIQIFDEKGNRLSAVGSELEKVVFDKEGNIYSSPDFSSSHHEATMGKSYPVEEGEGSDDAVAPLDQALDSGFSDFHKTVEAEKENDADLPCECWWKKQALSLYAHAKEANNFWSIFIAAAVMGLVIIGHHWQHERWQCLHHKWKFGVSDERMAKMFGPICRFKDMIIGGHRRGFLVRGSTSAES